ncbi:MAG: RNA polymerase sigma factor [Calditrichaeota bacterium]|nr:MAG: RNA polymerase sigma factor [Calditrichota bacterium]
MNKKEKLFHDVLKQYSGKIYRLCYAMVYDKSARDDLYQEVLLHLWQSLDRFRKESDIGTWVYRVTVNTALSHNRRHKRDQKIIGGALPADDGMAATDTIAEKKEQEQRLEKLHRAIRQLPEADRMLIGFYLEELSYKEIAKIMGISVNHVGVKMNRAKTKLMKVYNNG